MLLKVDIDGDCLYLNASWRMNWLIFSCKVLYISSLLECIGLSRLFYSI